MSIVHKNVRGMVLTSFFLPLIVIALGIQLYVSFSNQVLKENTYQAKLLENQLLSLEKGLRRRYISNCQVGVVSMTELEGKYISKAPTFINGETYSTSIGMLDGKPVSVISVTLKGEPAEMIFNHAIMKGSIRSGDTTLTRTKVIRRSLSPKQQLSTQQAEMFQPYDC